MDNQSEINDQRARLIESAVRTSAENARDSAGFSGGWGDGGAGAMTEKLNAWLDGYNFAKTGKTLMYYHIIEEHERMIDPDYQKYLELKKKFETK